jgi:hypothetical protein
MSNVVERVCGYVSQGLPVFPLHHAVAMKNGGMICSCGKLTCTAPAKHPLARVAPNGHKNATLDPRIAGSWFTSFPDANVAIATGGKIVVVDVDVRNNGDESLRALENEYGPLPQTWRTVTGGGGEHIFFAPPPDAKLSGRVLAKGIDFKATGGYIVAPPSVHISGRRYEWNVDFHFDDVPLAPLPEWLLRKQEVPSTPQGPRSDWGELITSILDEATGNSECRNKALLSIFAHLTRRYVDVDVAIELARLWNEKHCRPPLDDAQIDRVINWVLEREMRRQQNG